ncbi:hypothetical protein M501DRAFT_1002627 [Patellaria atrata CBS 101060]|uniref:Protein transport protein sec16 n=1 Tax=Patellaria atrata CBS 101060 TaxID=1346257 RepID=A0A9P4SCR3_9PEZI|nr:hypothetical protein M501DRAFT_1002627 [Patellaria atrata CBS 101060]
MASDDEGPNFSYAYNERSSWNPALRPNTDSDHISKQSSIEHQDPADPIQDPEYQLESSSQGGDFPGNLSRASAGLGFEQPEIHVEQGDNDESFGRYGGSTDSRPSMELVETRRESSSRDLGPQASNSIQGGETASSRDTATSPHIFSTESSSVAQKALNEEKGNGLEATENTDAVGQSLNSVEDEPANPADGYEYQGETTALEEAVQEDSNVSLINDPGTPAVDWGNSTEAFDIGASDTREEAITQNTERGGLDGFPDNYNEDQKRESGLDWEASEEVDFNFSGEDRLNLQAIQDIGPDATKPSDKNGSNAVQEPKQEDLDAMWQAALGDDELLEDDEGMDPSAFFDDGEGFLEDLSTTLETTAPPVGGTVPTTSKYTPATTPSTVSQAQNSYTHHGPQFTDFSQLNQQPGFHSGRTSSYNTYTQANISQNQPIKPALPTAESFVAKAKGGYSSPYDLPEDLSRPLRKRPTMPPISTASSPVITAPPRSSSISNGPPSGPPRSGTMSSIMSPPSSSHSSQVPFQSPLANGMNPPSQPTPKSSSEFFADLPIVSKPRPTPQPGRYAPQITAPTPPIQGPPQHSPPPQLPFGQAPLPANSSSSSYISQLQRSDPLPTFPDTEQVGLAPLTRSSTMPVPAPPAPSRYSPAPSTVSAAPARYSPAPPPAPHAAARYSPAPPNQPPGVSNHARYQSEPPGPPKIQAQQYTPRTSSPLAYHTASQSEDNQHSPPRPNSSGHGSTRSESYRSASRFAEHAPSVGGVPLAQLREEGELDASQPPHILQQYHQPPPQSERLATPPPPKSGASSLVGSPRRRNNYAPTSDTGFAPPKRSQTQSPSTLMRGPGPMFSMGRPASVQDLTSPTSVTSHTMSLPHRRGFSQERNFIIPTDERGSDTLERWKGYPIFKWGVGGSVVTTFPKQIPRYAPGSTVPMLKCTPGEVKVQCVKDLFPLSEAVIKFPGPLKPKAKKKEVCTWVKARIETLEQEGQHLFGHQQGSLEGQTRFDEKLLLWKVMDLLIENDGTLEGSPAITQTVRNLLSASSQGFPDAPKLVATSDLVGSAKASSAHLQPEPLDPEAVNQLRLCLSKGDREAAVWHAVDQRLWAHALLISSTCSKEIWKQVVQEFVRKEVKKMGDNTEPLAALYQVFAGNWEDSIDELVPASARAGFQMVSKSEGIGSTKNALEGLDRWRETLLLILSNRSEGDSQAILSLGKLLAGYGRVEAAHTCYLFARPLVHLSGADDPISNIVLLGFDHMNHRLETGSDLESILLTEVYEYALSLSGSTPIPHLQPYKLQHALTLAEYGYRSEAQSYCDAIFTAIKSTTKASPYYHGQFVGPLEDLSKRLSQSPKDGSSSWISKPSMDKVSSNMWAKFTTFVAGDDSDAASTGSGPEAGPFGKIAGDTPDASRSPSTADLYGSYMGGGSPIPPAAPGNSRYAPSSAYAPRTSMESIRIRQEVTSPQSPYVPGRTSLDSIPGRASMESLDSSGIRRGSDSPYMRSGSPQLNHTLSNSYNPSNQRMTASNLHNVYTRSDSNDSYTPSPYNATPPVEEEVSTLSDVQEPNHQASSYEPPTSGYEPPTRSYEPPSYQPYEPEPESESPQESSAPPPKKKSFMDDDEDDDIAARAAALKKQQRAEADRAADAAFRAAAEADAAKAQEPSSSRSSRGWGLGWFGGGGRKQQSLDHANKPIEAKLGEKNSFVYDETLKQWINKKAGASETATPVAATPPPPKGGAPRSASGGSLAPPPPTSNPTLRSSSMPPPMGIPGARPPPGPTSVPPPVGSLASPPMLAVSNPGSRAGTPALSDMGTPPMLPVLSALSGGPPASGPPSRPGTSMSNASSIDDLLAAPPGGRKAAGTVKKKKGRYVDVMAK